MVDVKAVVAEVAEVAVVAAAVVAIEDDTNLIYTVCVVLPDDTAAGSASVQLSAAWVKGAVVAVPVR